MSGVVTVRIFLASPQSDTVLAREAVVKAVRAIGADPAYRRRFQLALLRWDDAMRGLVFEAAGSPQRAIEVQIGKPGECDLVIGLFAHTMGGFLDVAHYGKHQKEDRPWHCTEWEIKEALEGREAGRVREVWLYKEDSDQPAPDRRWSPDEKDAYRKRSTDVERFLERLSPNPFVDPEGYKAHVDQFERGRHDDARRDRMSAQLRRFDHEATLAFILDDLEKLTSAKAAS